MAEYDYVGPVAHSSGTGNLPPTRIVIHCTAGTSDSESARSTANYFRQSVATGSAHAITDENELVVAAQDAVVCWHAPPNVHSLGIEIECSLANGGKDHWTLPSHVAKMHRAAKWVAEKCKLYDIPVVKLTPADLLAGKHGICGHVDVTNAWHQSTHTDPGPYFPWADFIGFVRDEYATLTQSTPNTPPETDMSAAEVQDLKNFIEARTQAYAVANNNYVRQVLATAVQTILHEIDTVDAASEAAITADLEAAFKTLSDQVLAAVTPPVADPPKA